MNGRQGAALQFLVDNIHSVLHKVNYAEQLGARMLRNLTAATEFPVQCTVQKGQSLYSRQCHSTVNHSCIVAGNSDGISIVEFRCTVLCVDWCSQ